MAGEPYFYAFAAGMGALLLLASVWSHLRPSAGRNKVVGALLPLLGFALVGSPIWSSISLKTEQLEISVERQRQIIEALAASSDGGSPPPFVPEPIPEERTVELAEGLDRGEVAAETLSRGELRALAEYTNRETQALARPWYLGAPQ